MDASFLIYQPDTKLIQFSLNVNFKQIMNFNQFQRDFFLRKLLKSFRSFFLFPTCLFLVASVSYVSSGRGEAVGLPICRLVVRFLRIANVLLFKSYF